MSRRALGSTTSPCRSDQRLTRLLADELQRQHTHADEVGPVDALEALGDDRLHAPSRLVPLAA